MLFLYMKDQSHAYQFIHSRLFLIFYKKETPQGKKNICDLLKKIDGMKFFKKVCKNK